MPYHQLTKYQRNELAALRRAGISMRASARLLGVHHSTVSRELARHKSNNLSGYDAKQARMLLQAKRLHANQSKRKLPTNIWLVSAVTSQLEVNMSPEQIAGWLKATNKRFTVCAQTIYDWLYLHARHLMSHLHCSKGKYRRKRETRLSRNWLKSQRASRHISKRPRHIESRKTYGHWEGDTVRGKNSDGYIATFVERKSGYLLAYKLDRATALSFAEASEACFSRIKPSYRKTLTLDNGSEMAEFEAIERRTGVDVFFATPYHSWERGTNENTNGLLRFYFPKGSSFKKLTQEQLDLAVNQLNTRPRKRLGYKSPSQVLKASGAIRIGV